MEEDKRLKLPTNWESKKARLEWELATDLKKKVHTTAHESPTTHQTCGTYGEIECHLTQPAGESCMLVTHQDMARCLNK